MKKSILFLILFLLTLTGCQSNISNNSSNTSNDQDNTSSNIPENSYTVTWLNYDGTLLETDYVEYGTMPSYGGDVPTKIDDLYTYVFSGWSPEITQVYMDVVYTAQFDRTAYKYGFNYEIKQEESGEDYIEIISPLNGETVSTNPTMVKIPSSIKINNKEIPVKSISSKAFSVFYNYLL